MATAIAPLSFKVFEKALNSALDELQKSVKIAKLTEPQSRSAFNFLSGNETFVSLPTGHGNSAWKPCESNLAGAYWCKFSNFVLRVRLGEARLHFSLEHGK